MTNQISIQFDKVSKTFRGHKVLDAISLEIKQGDRVAFVGSNGAGKTTLFRCLLGEYLHDGTVTINGQQPRSHRQEVLKQIGFVPQLPPPLKMPVGQLIQFAAGVCDSDPARIFAVSKELGLDAHTIRHQPFVKLSGGQKQKLLISIALGRDTDLLVMDEPAANLDPEARHRFFQLLAQKQQDVAMIISSHRLDEVSSLVNRVIEMDMGKIVIDDRVADDATLTDRLSCRIVLKRPEPAFAKALDGWSLTPDAAQTTWTGDIAGPDRLRFLGIVSRYTALIADLSLSEA